MVYNNNRYKQIFFNFSISLGVNFLNLLDTFDPTPQRQVEICSMKFQSKLLKVGVLNSRLIKITRT